MVQMLDWECGIFRSLRVHMVLRVYILKATHRTRCWTGAFGSCSRAVWRAAITSLCKMTGGQALTLAATQPAQMFCVTIISEQLNAAIGVLQGQHR